MLLRLLSADLVEKAVTHSLCNDQIMFNSFVSFSELVLQGLSQHLEANASALEQKIQVSLPP